VDDRAQSGFAVRAARLRVTGRVQGVFYRSSAQREGERLGLAGWVRNRNDGSVEAHVQGPAASIETLIAWCRQGPPHADVAGVEVTEAQPDKTLTRFTVRP
jgi:acylphosphatase